MFKHLIWISALLIAACAALFSVTGIATLYAGALIPAAVMATTLEAGKLVSASYLYRYWILTPKALRTYLIAGVTVLMFITSFGIYAYLTASYAKIAVEPTRMMNEISLMNSRQQSLNQNIDRYQQELGNLENRINEAQKSVTEERQLNLLLNNQRQSSTSSLLNQLSRQADSTRSKLERSVLERDSLESQKVIKRTEVNKISKIGTFVYIAEMLNIPLDEVVKYFTLVIVFVFDPLAVTLVLAYNIIVMSEKKKKEEEIELPKNLPLPPPLEEDQPENQEEFKEEFSSSRISMIKALKESHKNSKGELPYYARPDYDWNEDRRWETDKMAINYLRKARRITS